LREDDGTVKGCGRQERDVRVQRVTQPDDEELDLLWLCQRGVATSEGNQVLAEVIDGAIAPQHSKLTTGAIIQRRTKVRIEELHELLPCWATAIELHVVELELHVIEQVQCRERHPLVLWSPVNKDPGGLLLMRQDKFDLN
jgi:hypothetical protein